MSEASSRVMDVEGTLSLFDWPAAKAPSRIASGEAASSSESWREQELGGAESAKPAKARRAKAPAKAARETVSAEQPVVIAAPEIALAAAPVVA